MNDTKIILKLEKTRISNTAVYMMYNTKLPKETAMKRVDDGWINISQCFKLENFTASKIKRHKILEDEEQAGAINIEKITGGWGRFQGSWISTDDAIYLFKKYSFQNYVNLTLLSFKEDPSNLLPFKQDVKHYEPVTFEFEAMGTNLGKYKKIKDEQQKPGTNSGSQKETEFRNMNATKFQTNDDSKKKKKPKSEVSLKAKGIKRLSLQQLSAIRQDCEGYEESIENENYDSLVGDINDTPYKKFKSSQNEPKSFITDSFSESYIPENNAVTPFSSSHANSKNQLSTFKTYNSNHWKKSSEEYDNHKFTPMTNNVNNIFGNSTMSPLITQNQYTTPSNKKKSLNEETYKNLLINALESDQKNEDVVKLLYTFRYPKTVDPNFVIDEEGNTALHWAAAQGNIALAKYLIDELKTDPFKCNSKGMNCLSKALFFDNNFKSNIFSGLLTLLANCLVVQDVNGKLPLHYIIELCSSKVKNINVSIYYLDLIIKFLSIEFDVPYSKDEHTGQMNYSKRSFIKMALNCQDLNGNTPLHLAAMNANFDIYNIFITLGGHPATPNNMNQTPYHILQRHYNEIVESYNSKLKDPIALEMSGEAKSIVKKEDDYYTDEREQNSSEDKYKFAYNSKKSPPILKLEKDSDDMLNEKLDFGLTDNSDGHAGGSNRRASNSNILFGIKKEQTVQLDKEHLDIENYQYPLPAKTNGGMKKGKSLPANALSPSNTNIFQNSKSQETAVATRSFFTGKANKLAPLNLSRLNSSQTMLKRSPDPNILFLSRNNLQNQDMVQSLRNCNSKINQLFENLNEIYATREEKLLELEAYLNSSKIQVHRLAIINTFFKQQGLYERQGKTLVHKPGEKDVFNTISQWKQLIQKSQKTQLTLKSAMSIKSEHTEDDTPGKLVKLKQMLQLEKERKTLLNRMDSVTLSDSGDIIKDKYIKVLTRILKQSVEDK